MTATAHPSLMFSASLFNCSSYADDALLSDEAIILLTCIVVFMAMGSATSSKKRNDLSLQQKVSGIKASEKVPKPSIRKLAEEFNCRKTQISTILQNKHEIYLICMKPMPLARFTTQENKL